MTLKRSDVCMHVLSRFQEAKGYINVQEYIKILKRSDVCMHVLSRFQEAKGYINVQECIKILKRSDVCIITIPGSKRIYICSRIYKNIKDIRCNRKEISRIQEAQVL